ncbi:ATP-dependent DNA ligase [Candidatus Pacearchaeota archaeon]|nr:ATP-dependent DNA ligase [Candidatus Pacearchaeota archaeon]
MDYLDFVVVYEELSSTSKRLEKVSIIAKFLKVLRKEGKIEWIYLLNGDVAPDYDTKEIGMSRQLVIKAIAHSFGIEEGIIIDKLNKIGDIGKVAEEIASKRKQTTLVRKKLSVEKVFENLRKLMFIEGKGAVEKKVNLVAELLGSASGKEAKYIARTILSDLKIGIAAPTIIDAIAVAFFENSGDVAEKIQESYDLSNDFAIIFEAASKGLREIKKIGLEPGRPINVMLAVKVSSIEEAFEVCGKPAAIEQKYDGFRVLINKKNNEITLFTRRLENVTLQFPDVVDAVRKNIKGDNFILDSEIVGYNPKTEKYMPFEAISRRIKRKYDIDKLVKELPVEVNIFDVIYYNGEGFINKSFRERRKVVEEIVNEKKLLIRPAVQIITGDEHEADKFYQEALRIGEEGIMIKKLDAPYKQGRRVGYMAKLKPVLKDLDLVVTGAEYGTGKRGGWLTSYIVSCKDGENLLEVGKVSSGLKEKENTENKSSLSSRTSKEVYREGTTYEEMTNILKKIIIEEKENFVRVKPKIIVSVNYQNIQESPSYSSGYALRFPRITHYRPDRRIDDIATFEDIKKAAKKGKR